MKTRSFFCLLLALCLLMSGLPAAAAEEIETYDLYIAGVQVTSQNKDDLSVIEGVSGTVRFDPNTNTLTLENAEIQGVTGEQAEQFTAVYGRMNRMLLNVEVYGVNTVLGGEGGKNSHGMFAEQLCFHLHDGAALTVRGAQCPDYGGQSAGIYTHYGVISFDGSGSVEAIGSYGRSSSYGLINYGTVNVESGIRLTAVADPGASDASMGISCNYLNINGAQVLASAGGGEKCYRTCGVDVGSGAGTTEPTLKIHDGSLIATAGTGSFYSYGINARNGMAVENAKVLAYTSSEKEPAQALNAPPVLAANVFAGASTNCNGSSPMLYDEERNAEYRWFTTPYPAPRYSVTVEPGKNIRVAEGKAQQSCIWYEEIAPVICEAAEGYWFPVDYTVPEQNGIYAVRESKHRIAIYGMPQANTVLKLPDAPKDPNPFVDVKEEDYFYDPVIWAYNAKPQITAGTDATHFSPGATCSRAQVVTFLWRAKGCPNPKLTTNPFKDVKKGAYYYSAVLWAVEKKITSGVSSTMFGTNDGCTRAQVVTFLWRTEGQPKPSTTSNPFQDVTGGYYYDAVLWAVEKGITSGTSSTTFSPNTTCTRGQIVTFLYRALAG